MYEIIVTKYTIVFAKGNFLLKINYYAERVIGCNSLKGKVQRFCFSPGPQHIGAAKELCVINIMTRRLHQVVK